MEKLKKQSMLNENKIIVVSIDNNTDLISFLIFFDSLNYKPLYYMNLSLLDYYDILFFCLTDKGRVEIVINKKGVGQITNSIREKNKILNIPYKLLNKLYNIDKKSVILSSKNKYFNFIFEYE